jgi:elongation factor 1 alpha-like protein
MLEVSFSYAGDLNTSILFLQVEWSRVRYDEIESSLRPFLAQSGFSASKLSFVPVGAMLGVNLVDREGKDSKQLLEWFSGPTLVDCLGMSCYLLTLLPIDLMLLRMKDAMEPPPRDYANLFRLPISNIFKTQSTSGVYVSGRIAGGIVQVGEKVRAMPGDESVTGIVKCMPLLRSLFSGPVELT